MTDLIRSVLRVGDGRGFVAKRLNYRDLEEQIIITAAHCLPTLPPPHPSMYLMEKTYEALLGELGSDDPTVWAECLFVDPVSDIAVLGSPDNQALSDQADEYERLLEDFQPLTIADAPAQGREFVIIGDRQGPPLPGEGPVRLLSLEGHRVDGRVSRRGHQLLIEPEEIVVGGMSGSPIVSMAGEAIAICSTVTLNPVLMDSLPAWLVRAILRAG